MPVLKLCIYFIRKKKQKDRLGYLVSKVDVTFLRCNMMSSSGLRFFSSGSLGCYLNLQEQINCSTLIVKHA